MPQPDTAHALGAKRFAFAIIADTHINETETQSSSPYASNLFVNGRLRHALHLVNRLAPDFVVHMGDLTHPIPNLPAYEPAVARFQAMVESLQSKLHVMPGNHDIGDKPGAWLPAHNVSAAFIERFEHHFGPHYYSFDYADCHFVVINSPVLNSGLAVEAEQRTWLEADFAEHAGQRTFVFTHYPLFVRAPDEAIHYDNIDEPARSWLLNLLAQYKPEALFCSHVHHFFYNRYAETDCYMLPSLAFTRQDYSEFFRVEPAGEYGRNDTTKLGFVQLTVYEQGHVLNIVPTGGAVLAEEEEFAAPHTSIAPRHSKENTIAPLGVHLRHPWAEETAFPATGAVDEFERKVVRNDYPLLALWNMGLRKLRVPWQDLAGADTRARMRLLQEMGHEFTVYTYGIPSGPARAALIDHHNLLSAWEVIDSWHDLDGLLAGVDEMRQRVPLRVLLSKLRSPEEEQEEGELYYHHISHGLLLSEADDIARLAQRAPAIDGLAFRLRRHESPWTGIPTLAQRARQHGWRAAVELRMVSNNPAAPYLDDLSNANRVAEALLASLSVASASEPATTDSSETPALDLFVDTLVDVDRGYFVHSGLVDRRCTLRLAGRIVRHLYGLLHPDAAHWDDIALPDPAAGVRLGDIEMIEGGRLCPFTWAGMQLFLLLPQAVAHLDALALSTGPAQEEGTAHWVDLDTGLLRPLAWRRANLPTGPGLRLLAPQRVTRPAVLAVPA